MTLTPTWETTSPGHVDDRAVEPRDLAWSTIPIFDEPVVYLGEAAETPFGPWREDLARHLERWGPRPMAHGRAGLALIDRLEAANLTGRGGAHVPSHLKWRAARADAPGGIVVVNGAEGEPASGKDAALLQLRPHLVLDGAALAAEAIDAREVVVWLHASAHQTRSSVEIAIGERSRIGGEIPMRIELAPDAYVSGESSSVIRALQGGLPLPQFSRDRARPWGDGPAILVHNTETHARVAQLARGAQYPTTSLLTITEASAPLKVSRRIVVEVDADAELAEVLATLRLPAPQAILLGGYSGTWLAWADASGLVMSPQALAARSLSLGAGVVYLLPPDRDGAREAAAILGYLASQSAGQCGPCIFGLPELAQSMSDWARSRRRRKRAERHLDSLEELIPGRGACRHPDGALRMAMSAREAFAR